MANLSMNVQTVGADLVVSGTAFVAVTITVNGTTLTGTPDAMGHYSVTFLGAGGTSTNVSASSGGKIDLLEIDSDIAGVDFASTTNLMAVKAKRLGGDKIKLSGQYCDNNHPAKVKWEHNSADKKEGPVDASKKWSVTFDNCPGGGHRFKLV
jgi:hypothetical protein